MISFGAGESGSEPPQRRGPVAGDPGRERVNKAAAWERSCDPTPGARDPPQRTPGMEHPRFEWVDQNCSLAPNWIWREVVEVAVTTPAVGEMAEGTTVCTPPDEVTVGAAE